MNIARSRKESKTKKSHLSVLQALDVIGINVLIFGVFLLFVVPAMRDVFSMDTAIAFLFLAFTVATINIIDGLLSLWPIGKSMPYCIKLRNRGHFVEKIYKGDFDRLLGGLYETGLEIEGKFGNSYTFSCKRYLGSNIRYLVQDHGEYCTIRSSFLNMSFIEKTIELSKEASIENAGSREEH